MHSECWNKTNHKVRWRPCTLLQTEIKCETNSKNRQFLMFSTFWNVSLQWKKWLFLHFRGKKALCILITIQNKIFLDNVPESVDVLSLIHLVAIWPPVLFIHSSLLKDFIAMIFFQSNYFFSFWCLNIKFLLAQKSNNNIKNVFRATKVP